MLSYLANIMNIIYGGAFNPPTKAHYEIVLKLLNDFTNSKVIVLPVGNKYNKEELIEFKDRFTMLEILFKNNKDVVISDLENSDKFLGTVDSLKKLNKIYGDVSLTIGSDNLKNIDKWIKYEELLENYPLIIFKRDNDDIEKMMNNYRVFNPKYNIVNYSNDINSTAIRNNLEENKEWLTKEVYQYIKNHKLYEVKKDV